MIQHWITAQPDRPKYTDDDDSVYLEDESGRVKLTGAKVNQDLFVTGKDISLNLDQQLLIELQNLTSFPTLTLGVIMGVLGSEDNNGDFKVVDVCYAGEGTQEQPAPMETGTIRRLEYSQVHQKSSI